MADFFASLAAQAVGAAPRIVPVVPSMWAESGTGPGEVHEVREIASEALGADGYASHAGRPPSDGLEGMDDGGRSRGTTGSHSGSRVSPFAEPSAEVPIRGPDDGRDLPSNRRGRQEVGGQRRGDARPPGSLALAAAPGHAANSVPVAVTAASSPPAKPGASVPYSANSAAGDADPGPHPAVHVSISIGRVEVRVPPAPPTPISVREPVPAPAPRLTLDEYLGRSRKR
jgi:hypothetical protein